MTSSYNDDEELGRLKEEENKKINEEYQEVINPKNPELKNNLLGHVGGIGTEVAAGLALDAKTQWMLGAGPAGWAGYIAANAAGEQLLILQHRD